MQREENWLNLVTDALKYETKYVYGTDTKCAYTFDNQPEEVLQIMILYLKVCSAA